MSTNYQLSDLKYSKQDLQKLLGYQSLSSVYQLLKTTCLLNQLFYSHAELRRLQISKALITQKKSRAEIQLYWAKYLSQKEITQF